MTATIAQRNHARLEPKSLFFPHGFSLSMLAVQISKLYPVHSSRRGTFAPRAQRYRVSERPKRWGWPLTGAVLLLSGCLRSPAPPPPRFRDVSPSVGLKFTHDNGASGRKYFVETMGAGVAFLDYNNDGWLDILCVNGRPLPGSPPRPTPPALFRSVRGQRFENVTAAAGLSLSLYGMGCAVGDYNADGWPDLYVSAVLGPGRLLCNRGGRFEDVTTAAGVANSGRWGTSCAWLDYDRDGRLDLFIANYVRYASLADDIPCYVRPGRRSYCIPQPYRGSASVLYRNVDGARFEDVSRRSGVYDLEMKGLGVAVLDLEDDGWPDLCVANDTVPNRLFHNVRGRYKDIAAIAGVAFSEGGSPRAGMGVDSADWRGDGSHGVAVTHFPGEALGLFCQERPQSETFRDLAAQVGLAEASRPYLGFGTRFLDFDNDGDLDLCVVNGHVRDDIAELTQGQTHAQPALLFQNLEGERFEDASEAAGPPITTPRVGRGLATGDYDNDGRVDLLVSENGGPARLWRNETPARGHWLLVRLVGPGSNRDGLGARVTVLSAGREQSAWACSGASYLSASDSRLHFGLGSAPVAERVTVRWPGGRVTTLRDVRADRLLTVREAESQTSREAAS
jgi:hypothetical protein